MRYLLLALLFGLCSQPVLSQTNYTWWDPTKNSFPVVEGRGWHEGLANPYDRLPAAAEKDVRKPVWFLSHHSAGLMICFRSNATDIRVRYTVGGKLDMPHMPSTGVSGVDLYAVNENGAWEWTGGKYSFGDTIEYHFSSLPSSYLREYHLYLPLYNNVTWMEIGVPENQSFNPLPLRKDKPIVVYGTSIAQGACASRPGMAWTNILGRRLHDPIINLAFSGNGRLEEGVVKYLTQLDPKIYIVDCLPNMTGFPADTTKTRLIKTVRTLRESKPHVPVLIVEDADANMHLLDSQKDDAYKRVNTVAKEAFAQLKSEGVEQIYYLTASDIGFDNESTVEGTHPNDYGMEKYASAYEKAIRNILHEPKGTISTTQPCKQYRDRSYDWNERHAEELNMNKTDPPKIVFMGNSITHFWGGLPKDPFHRGADSWDKYFAPYGVRNFGYGWDRIENVLWRVYHGELDGYKAKQVILMIGTNNIGYNTDEEIVKGLKFLISEIKWRQPDTKILLLGIYPRRGQEKRIRNLNNQIVLLTGTENISYADPGKVLLKAPDKIDDNLFIQDGVHPNADGYRRLGKAISPYLIKK
ncbi:MAG: SGNH/GDSL hydrolase family protein [Thermoflavifilum aggregans]|nr:SGNH/GDSL hydrolase family protein [Thermoflavifilum aggregans]